VFDQFNRWLNDCVNGALSEVDPGCRDAVALTGLEFQDITHCLPDIADPRALAVCAGTKAAGAILLILNEWLDAGRGGPPA
jgi:hypothetical protein